jgi:hypothetical protein
MAMTTIKSAAASLLLIGALLASVTGCAPDASTAADSSSSPTATTPAATTPTSTPSVESTAGAVGEAEASPPNLSALVVTASGIDSLVMGEPIPLKPETTALAVWDPEFCVTDSRPVGDPWAGAWLANYSTSTVDWAQTPVQAFTVYPAERMQDGVLSGFTVWSPELKTATGIHPGSTRAELESAYPSFISVTNKPTTDVYVLADPDGGTNEIWFEVATEAYAVDAELPSSIVGLVMWIQVVPTGYAPYSLTETDSGGSACVA